MKHRTQQRNRGRWVLVACLSLAAHGLLLGLLLPNLVGEPFEAEPTEPEKPFEVSVVDQDDLERLLRDRRVPEPPKPEEEPEEPPQKPEEEPEKEPEEVEPRLEKIDRKVVEQVTNDERPDEANFISQQDNKTAEETRARETTTEQVVPSKTERDTEAARLAKAEVSKVERDQPTRARRSFANPSEIVKERETADETESGDLPGEKRRKLFEMTPEEYARVVGHQHDESAHEAMQEKRLFAGWEEDEAVMRGALENFITEVKPGNHTSVNSHGRAWADYLGRIHRKIHVRWASGYLATLDLREDAGSPLNNPQLNTKLEFVIRARDGVVDRINIVRSSGELRFDAEAVLISKSVGPHPSPPRELVSPDGNVYVHWNFWRDQRQCGVFGASIFLVEKDEG